MRYQQRKTSTSHTKKEPTYKRHHPTKYKSPDATAPFKICVFQARLELWRGTVSDVSRYTLCNESNLHVALPRGYTQARWIRDTQGKGIHRGLVIRTSRIISLRSVHLGLMGVYCQQRQQTYTIHNRMYSGGHKSLCTPVFGRHQPPSQLASHSCHM